MSKVLPENDADYRRDLAGTFQSTAGEHERVDPALTCEDLASIEEHGYVVVEDLLSQSELDLIRKQAAPHLTHFGRNPLEGVQTKRVYSVMSKTSACNPLADSARVQCILDAMLQPNYLLSMFQIIEIHPGEQAQLLHYDDSFYPVPRPRPPISVASILAVDDFTSDNGGTVIVPGSHKWPDGRRPTSEDPMVSLEMKAGSAVIFAGTLWHGGGANRTEKARLAVTCQYCEPWARTQENMCLAVPRSVVRELSGGLQRMLGYSVHAPFMGNVNGLSPLRLLQNDQIDSSD